MDGLLGNYNEFMSNFLENDYSIKLFTDQIQPKNNLIVRHDVDFDVSYAKKISEIENQLGIQSTFFFLVRSPFYNILEKETYEIIESIREDGHQISVHFDSSNYEDIESGVVFELSMFNELFNVKPKVISIHRPDKIFIEDQLRIKGVAHTYQPEFFRDIKYIADSRGSFRYGHPYDTEEFKNKESIHLCTHPIWWATGNHNSPVDLIEDFLRVKANKLSDSMRINFIPFRNHKI